MGNLKSKIISHVIKPYSDSVFDTTLATVTEYDDYYNRATIKFQDPKGLGILELEHVPVQIGSGGVHSSAPAIGSHVWVTFANKSALSPKIVSLADEKYQYDTREKIKHGRQGSTLPFSICDYNPHAEPTDVSFLKPSINDWLDIDNNDYTKYIDFVEVNPLATLQEATKNLNYYNPDEPGITHPNNSSTIKVRDNGMIDIMVATNQGFRIDPKTNTVNVIGTNIKNRCTNYNIASSESVNIVTKKFTVNGVDFTSGGGGGGYTFENL